MTRSQPAAAASLPAQKSTRTKKERKTFGSLKNSDKHLKGLRRGILYSDLSSSKKQSAHNDEMIGCSRDVHGECWIEPDPFLKQADEVWHYELRPRGWTYKNGSGLSNWAFYAPGVSARTATEGITMFCSYDTLAQKLKEDDGDVSKILQRAREATAANNSNNHDTTSVEANNDNHDDVPDNEALVANNPAPATAATSMPVTVAVNRTQVENSVWNRLFDEESTEDVKNEPSSPVLNAVSFDELSDENEPPLAVKEVMEWLLDKLPYLRTPFVEEYSKRLVEIGFDCVAILDKELWVQNQETNVLQLQIKMKDAHRRALLRAIQKNNVHV